MSLVSSPLWTLLGGALIGLGASVLWLVNGRIAGISGIVAGLAAPERSERGYRAWFIGGLLTAGVLAQLVDPARLGTPPRSLALLALAGLLVGFGTRLGRGCTSGHGVCGISRLSATSLAATLTFIAAGVLSVAALRMLTGSP